MFSRREKRIDNREPIRAYVWAGFGLILFGVITYGYLVHNSIVNIVSRQNLETEISTISAQVVSLEAEYIKLKNGVTAELAQSLGFVSPVSKKFVTKSAVNPGLSLVTEAN